MCKQNIQCCLYQQSNIMWSVWVTIFLLVMDNFPCKMLPVISVIHVRMQIFQMNIFDVNFSVKRGDNKSIFQEKTKNALIGFDIIILFGRDWLLTTCWIHNVKNVLASNLTHVGQIVDVNKQIKMFVGPD